MSEVVANGSSRRDLNKLADSLEKLHEDWEAKYGGAESLEFQNPLFQLRSEMQKLMGRGSTNSRQYNLFIDLCIKGYLVVRLHCEVILH